MATFEADGSWFPKIRGRYVLYLRASDRPHSRLNILSQRKAVIPLLSKGRAHEVEEFIEIEPQQAQERVLLQKAIDVCREKEATLIFGKIDRMRGRIEILERLFDQRIKFRCADLPHLYSSTLYRFKLEEQEKRRSRGDKIRDGLDRARSNGVVLGGRRANSHGLKSGPSKSLKMRRLISDHQGKETWELIADIRDDGASSLTEIATKLNNFGHRAPRGGAWSPAQVRRIIQKFEG